MLRFVKLIWTFAISYFSDNFFDLSLNPLLGTTRLCLMIKHLETPRNVHNYNKKSMKEENYFANHLVLNRTLEDLPY